MNKSLSDAIHPPHEVFYLEAMLFCTATALSAADDVRDALDAGASLDPSSHEWAECARRILDGVQVIAGQAAALSRYFWPARSREPHSSRAERLRTGLEISSESRLRDRELRNQLEHFDERLDHFCHGLMAGIILPTYVGPIPDEPEVPTHHFRAYYTDIAVFEVLGHRTEIQPLLDEITDLHERFLRCAERGGRIPPASDGQT